MEVNDTTNKRIVLRQVIRACSESSIDNDKYGDIQSTAHDSGTHPTEENLQKKTGNENQTSNNLKDQTVYVDDQHEIQFQSKGKKGTDIIPAMTSSELEILLNMAGSMGSRITDPADTTPLGPKRGFSPSDKIKT